MMSRQIFMWSFFWVMMVVRLLLMVMLRLALHPTDTAATALRLHTFLDSHMVLQRAPQQAHLWGWGASSSFPWANTVTVSLFDSNGKEVASALTSTKADGSWSVDLAPQPASTGYSLTIWEDNSTANSSIHLEDIAFGDVYLCSGQSNMEMSVREVFNTSAEIQDSIHYPHLRLATASLTSATEPQEDVTSKATNYTWMRSNPEAFDLEDPFGYYSATCYFFGRELYKSLDGKVPIGLVTSCWGGQRVEAFSSPEALADETCGGTMKRRRRQEEQHPIHAESVFPKGLHEHHHHHSNNSSHYEEHQNFDYINEPPSSLWNGMIHPFLLMRFTGALWYQGEANADNATSYACRFPAMIADWRRQFDLPHLSFLYVELAAYSDDAFIWLRAAQRQALKLPQVGYASAIDLGDPQSTSGPIHPRRKEEVGRRLSLSVRAIQYNETELVSTGPRLATVRQVQSLGVLFLSFDPATNKGLHLHGAADCTSCCREPPYEILQANGQWKRVLSASVVQLKNETVVALTLPPASPSASTARGSSKNETLRISEREILGLRYAWDSYPQCLLYNGAGGPDDHAGLSAAPLERCAHPPGQGAWTGHGCKTRPTSTSDATNATDIDGPWGQSTRLVIS